MDRHVAIIGGGFSGTLLAINLLRHDGPRATLIERRAAQVARGVAYGAAQPDHLLNVRAGNMSAFPDAPAHFTDWLVAHDVPNAGGFVPRATYGAYLADTLALAMAAAPSRLALVRDEAVGLDVAGSGVRVALGKGGPVAADIAVLAPGNLPPHPLPAFAGLDEAGGVYLPDPWTVDPARGLSDGDHVLLIGSGLTAVDVALTLDAAGCADRISALSRRGLSPRAHGEPGSPPARTDRPRATGSHLVAHVRRRAAAIGWRGAIDELRPYTQDIWRSADDGERARFLRHLRPYWDVHRHRLAPAVADRIAGMEAAGRLRFFGGKVLRAVPVAGGAEVTWRPRGADLAQTMRVARIINCTGPQGDVLRSDQPLIASMVKHGLLRPDSLHLGIDTDRAGRVIDRAGFPSEHLYAVGPMTRVAAWEIVAVPDLRQQAWDLSRRLSAVQWVGGEGL